MNDIWANTSRLLSLELCTEEMLVTYQQAMCESKKFQHVRTCTLIAFVRLYIFTISKPPAPRLIAAPAMTQVTIRKNACHFIPPPGGQKRSSISGSKRKTRIQNKPSIHENMKIRFTIVSIKKHWATVCTVESSLNYRQVTHEAKKNKNCLRVFSWTSEQSVPRTQHIHPLSAFSHTFTRSFSAFEHSSPG